MRTARFVEEGHEIPEYTRHAANSRHVIVLLLPPHRIEFFDTDRLVRAKFRQGHDCINTEERLLACFILVPAKHHEDCIHADTRGPERDYPTTELSARYIVGYHKYACLEANTLDGRREDQYSGKRILRFEA